MAISETDNRIQLPPTEVDFDNVVGITGQVHDDFPSAGAEPRYDTMRSFLIGLLSNQSSDEPPTQYRTGTIWYNRSKRALYVWNGDAWASIASFIALSETSDSIVSLADWYEVVQEALQSVQPRVTFSGYSEVDNATVIPVPSSVQSEISDFVSLLHPLVYKNGVLIDPRNTKFSEGCPTSILLLSGENLDSADRFTVVIERFDLMVTGNVVLTS